MLNLGYLGKVDTAVQVNITRNTGCLGIVLTINGTGQHHHKCRVFGYCTHNGTGQHHHKCSTVSVGGQERTMLTIFENIKLRRVVCVGGWGGGGGGKGGV